MTDALAASPLARAVGLALLEFVWQGAAIGGLTACLLIALRKSTAQARYVVGCLSLAVMVAVPVVTVARYMRDAAGASAGGALTLTGRLEETAVSTAGAGARPESSAEGRINASRQWIEARLPFVVLIWSGGVLALGLHLLGGWIQIGRIRRRATPVPLNRWPESVRAMADELGVTRRLRLIDSALVDVPAVLGWLRPTIVVPASALTGLSPAHLDAILAHELAHVHRGDYLINVFQCVVEILLFYHPAVWWVSRQIRREREHCCDDLAATLCADRVTYVSALVSLEELRVKTPRLAMAASDGDLLNRVRRLLEPGSAAGPRLSGGFAMAVMMTVLLLAVSGPIEGMPRGSDYVQSSIVEPASSRIAAPAPPTPVAAKLPIPRDFAEPGAQTTLGKIAGVVTDRDGGVIVGAKVTVTSAAAQTVRDTTTNGRGEFAVGDLASGTYELTITMPGFTRSRGGVQIRPNETLASNVRLEVSALTEAVFVRSSRGSSPPTDPRTPADFFDAAKLYYEQGRLTEAENMTTRALALLRAAAPERPRSNDPLVSTSGPVRVGGDVTPPTRTRYVEPVYPAIAVVARVEGTVYLEAVIDRTGAVRDVRLLKGMPLLNDAAMDAVRQWLYSPTLLNGAPVEIVMTVSVSFRGRSPFPQIGSN